MKSAFTNELQQYQWHNLPEDKFAYIFKTDLASEKSNCLSEIVNSFQNNYDRPLLNRQLPC